jgi:small subunit ribosomal protein S8
MVGKNEVRVPSSKLKLVVAKELKKAKYLEEVKVEKAKPQDTIVITISKPGSNAAITAIKRLSKPGRRVYVAANDVPRVKNGRGMVLVSTSSGVVPGKDAIKNRVGGELLLEVY